MCGSGGSSSSGGGGSGAPRSTVVCPPRRPNPDQRYEVSCRWLDTEKYCGDDARLEVTCTPTPPDGSVDVEILHPTDSSVLATFRRDMSNGRMETTWRAKAHAANWREARIRFRGTVISVGVMNTSSNQFRFRRRPTTGWVNVNTTRPVPATCGGGAGKQVVYDVRLETNRVHQSLKLRAQSEALSAADLTRFKTRAKSDVETVWNNGFSAKKFHRRNCRRGAGCDCQYDCCKAGFRLDVNFVDSGDHWLVNVVSQPDPNAPTVSSWVRYNDSKWAFPPVAAASTYAHEAGHMLGQYDEYVTSCNDPSAAGTEYRQPAPAPAGERNLMSHSGNTTMLNRHYRRLRSFLNDNADGDPYDIIPAGP